MTPTLERIEERLREVICPRCARYTSKKTCSLPPDRKCAIFRSLPDVLEIVRRTHSWRIDPYADTLRLRVCAECPHEDDHGTCPIRESLDCALDAYFPLVVDEIESEFRRIHASESTPVYRDPL
ncbi:MAG: hypothetical protein DCC65_07520 [Planctomycetota bacterium]|nr:MAG: hypothetical protein DCC65_07520 [Planctomycetota bacterium]